MDLFVENGEVILHTARLTLRPPTSADRDAIVAGINDLDVARWLSKVPFPYALADADWYIDHVRAGGEQAWMIHDFGGLVGGMGVGAEFGYWLARRVWGQGYATEAGRVVLARHFENPAAADLLSGHFIDNSRSAHVLHKLGFEKTSPRRIACKALGREMDSQGLRLSRSRWQRLSNLL